MKLTRNCRMTQRARQRLGEIGALQRFVQHLFYADGLCTERKGCAPVTAHQDDRNIGPEVADLAGEFRANKVGHCLIGKH